MDTCPTCGRDSDSAPESMPLAESVTVFACAHCRTGVIRTFAHHGREPDEDLETPPVQPAG